ncbi:MAG: L,D-transpeptidase, partial [Gemmatimonadetes bacterium]|nr:L,D-transpeptidase [Gemmatimonadota bacterium]
MKCVSVLRSLALAAAVFGAGQASAQGLPTDPAMVAHGVEAEGRERYRDPPVNTEGRYIVVSLDEHRLYVMEAERVVWS